MSRSLAPFPAVEGRFTSSNVEVSVTVMWLGVHFKGARLFDEIYVGFCTVDLNGFGQCSKNTMTYGIFNIFASLAGRDSRQRV